MLRTALVALALLLGLGVIGTHPPEALARQSMSFSPGDRSRSHHASRSFRRASSHRGHGHVRATRHGRGRPHGAAHAVSRRDATTGGDEGDAAKAVPGKGFTMENGVLTYPAPARFQPQNLRHR